MLMTVRAAVWLLASGAVVRSGTMPRVARRWLRTPRAPAVDRARAQSLVRAVHRAGRVLRPSCLTRALAAGRLLAKDGLAARLTIGVARSPFAAHAWLEHDGLVLSGADPAREYTPLYTIEASPRPSVSRLA
jgi:hypothetical protein